jgi:hypothetical protein
MRALSVAEEVAAMVPLATADDVQVSCSGVDLMLHRRPEGVAQVGAARSWSATVDSSGGRPRIAVSGLVRGVAVRVWALGGTDETERYEAAAAPVALPAAWTAAVA